MVEQSGIILRLAADVTHVIELEDEGISRRYETEIVLFFMKGLEMMKTDGEEQERK